MNFLLRREDLPKAIAAMERAGFVYRHAMKIDMFLDGPQASPRDSVHIHFAGAKVREEDAFSTPRVEECDTTGGFHIVDLEALARMKLTSFRRKDQMHRIRND